MGILSKIFKKQQDEQKTGGMEDFMMLIKVYFQASLASTLGITNLAMLPDLRMFKATLHVPTVNNKLGLGEKQQCKKMLTSVYGIGDNFYKEIDRSISKNCKRMQDAQTYLIQFSGFTQDLMMLMGNLMKFKLRLPSIFKKALYAMTQKQIAEIFTKNDYSDPAVLKSVAAVRQYSARLGFSQQWMTDFVYNVVMLAKKEPKKDTDNDK